MILESTSTKTNERFALNGNEYLNLLEIILLYYVIKYYIQFFKRSFSRGMLFSANVI